MNDTNLVDNQIELVKRFLENDKKAMEYYEDNKIGFQNMLIMKTQNTENIVKMLKELKD